jgi:hypothetical protein
MPEKKRVKTVLTYPRIVKFLSIITALCMIVTFAINAIAMAAAYELKWGFADSPSRFQPALVMSNTSTTITIAIPVYVNNTAAIGFNVDDLSFDFSISNSSAVITQATSPIGSIPFGTNREFNLTLIDTNISDLGALSANVTLYIKIMLHVSYTFTTVTLGMTIEKKGGMSF